MAKLKTIRPLVGSLAPRLRSFSKNEKLRSRERDANQSWRRLYKTARWQKLRWSILVRDALTCKICSKLETDTSQLVCDHIEPHRGDEVLFWRGPFQTLCKPCHDSTKQREERGRMWHLP